jgi:hypothetical protein
MRIPSSIFSYRPKSIAGWATLGLEEKINVTLTFYVFSPKIALNLDCAKN